MVEGDITGNQADIVGKVSGNIRAKEPQLRGDSGNRKRICRQTRWNLPQHSTDNATWAPNVVEMNSNEQQKPPPLQIISNFSAICKPGRNWLAALAIGVFIGLKVINGNKHRHCWPVVLPLLILSGNLYKLYRETSRKNKMNKTPRQLIRPIP